MIVQSDPLAQAASTWSGLSAGPPCRACKVNLADGHRYYSEASAVVHYCCLAREEARSVPAATKCCKHGPACDGSCGYTRRPVDPEPEPPPAQGDLFGNLDPEPGEDDELARLFGGLV